MLIWCLIAVRDEVAILGAISPIVRVRFWSVNGAKDSVLMEMDWLNIMLIIESVIEHMVIFVINLMAVLVLIGRVAALMILINAMCVFIRSHISVI